MIHMLLALDIGYIFFALGEKEEPISHRVINWRSCWTVDTEKQVSQHLPSGLRLSFRLSFLGWQTMALTTLPMNETEAKRLMLEGREFFFECKYR